MDYKPSDFFVGVIDFFAVLFPGAIVVAVGDRHVPQFIVGSNGIVPRMDGDAERWIAFVFAAYLTGHLLFLVGATIDNAVYDPFRRSLVPTRKDTLFKRVKGLRNSSVGGSEKEINPFQWARIGLRLAAPEALNEVERYEADSKFFRSLSVALYGLLLVFLVIAERTPACFNGLPISCKGLAGVISALGIAATFGVGKFEYDRLDDRQKQVRADTPWEPTFFWATLAGFCLLLLVTTVWEQNWRALVLYALLGLCLWRYGERRWKSTKVSYQYVVFLANSPEYLHKNGRPGSPHGSGSSNRTAVKEAGAIAVAHRGGRPYVMLVRARQDPNEWIFPKGHIEPGETPEIAAVRELREESGVIGQPIARVGTLEFLSGEEQVNVDYYLVEARRVTESHEGRDARWCEIDRAFELLTFRDSRELLRRALPLIE